jgi:FkbM family methyltransferase
MKVHELSTCFARTQRRLRWEKRLFKGLISVFAFLIGVVGLFALVAPRRKNLLVKWTAHKIEFAHGCSAFTRGIFDAEDRFKTAGSKIIEIQREGPLAMYDTPIGSIWFPTSAWSLPAVVEAGEADPYRLRSTVQSGDVVLDIGAGVGTDTRLALDQNASLVVAVEPAPVSLECLRRNLSAEIRDKRALVVSKGAWKSDGSLTLYLDPVNPEGASFVAANRPESTKVAVTTIDQIVTDFKLPKVDLITVHVEGTEEEALLGAANTIRQFHPKLAVALEHHKADVDALPRLVRHIWPGYRVSFTGCTKTFNLIHPGVALLNP